MATSDELCPSKKKHVRQQGFLQIEQNFSIKANKTDFWTTRTSNRIIQVIWYKTNANS